MTATKHTPGPWHVGCRYGNNRTEIVDHSRSKVIATVWTHDRKRIDKPANAPEDFGTSQEGMANLQLMTEAVTLLDVCHMAITAIDPYAGGAAAAEHIRNNSERAAKELLEIFRTLTAAVMQATSVPPIR